MLQELNELTRLSDTRTQQRQQQAETYLFQGLRLLQIAHDEGFSNYIRLQEASGQLIEAIKFQRRDFRPYLAMAYIFVLIEDHAMAQKYVREAASLNPQHPLVRQFRQGVAESQHGLGERRKAQRLQARPLARPAFAASGGTGSLPQSSASGTDPADGDATCFDYDAQYDATESRIRCLLSEVMQSELRAPVGKDRELEDVRLRLAKRQQGYETALEELALLEAEIDCSELRRLLKPIEVYLRRGEEIMDASRQLIALKAQIHQEMTLVDQICEEARSTRDPADLELLEENYEVLLDNADTYAQAIESLLDKYDSLATIEAVYQALQNRLENYQEVLEEAHARLEA